MTIRVNCLACGHPTDLGDAYEDYRGEIRCWGCRAVLEVALQEGKLKAMRRSAAMGPSSASVGTGGAPEASPLDIAADIPTTRQETTR